MADLSATVSDEILDLEWHSTWFAQYASNHELATGDPNSLVDEMIAGSGLTGEQMEELRLRKPGVVYATYPVWRNSLGDRQIDGGVSEVHNVFPGKAGDSVYHLLMTDGALHGDNSSRGDKAKTWKSLSQMSSTVMKDPLACLKMFENYPIQDDRTVFGAEVFRKFS